MTLVAKGGRRRPWRGLVPALALALAALPAAAAADTELEAKVKAAYLYHLTRFVDWPALPASELRICVMGGGAIGGMMEDLSNRQVRERPLRIEVDEVADPARCQVLFVGRADRRLPDILKRVRGGSVLTVSDMDGFARQGGVVAFYAEAGRIKLEINLEAARAANLRVSAKLLELARSVPAPHD